MGIDEYQNDLQTTLDCKLRQSDIKISNVQRMEKIVMCVSYKLTKNMPP